MSCASLICILIVIGHFKSACRTVSLRFSEFCGRRNFFVQVDFLEKAGGIISSYKIDFGVLSKTNEIKRIFYLKPEFSCDFHLLDANGGEIPKTWDGQNYGSQFSKLTTVSFDNVNHRGHSTGGRFLYDMVFVHTNTAEGRSLPSPDRLFKIKKPGTYTLRIQFQVYKAIDDYSERKMKLVRLPQFEVPVIKLEETGKKN